MLFLKRGEYVFAKQIGAGMFVYYALGLMIWVKVDFTFFFFYWVYPLFEAISFLGIIAYLWHSFVDPDDDSNQYINSITILRGKDNIWNEVLSLSRLEFEFVEC